MLVLGKAPALIEKLAALHIKVLLLCPIEILCQMWTQSTSTMDFRALENEASMKEVLVGLQI